jgi:hypothetical protein
MVDIDKPIINDTAALKRAIQRRRARLKEVIDSYGDRDARDPIAVTPGMIAGLYDDIARMENDLWRIKMHQKNAADAKEDERPALGTSAKRK